MVVAVLATSLFAVPIVDGGKSSYTIIAADSEVAKVAADELREIIAKSTGVDLPVSTNKTSESQNCIFVGQSSASEKIFGKLELSEGDSRVMVKDDALLFCGGGWRGDLDAVYGFVREKLGYRIYSTEDGAEKIVKADCIELPSETLVYKRAFPKNHGLTHTYLYGSTNLVPYLFRNGSFGRKNWAAMTKYRDVECDLPMRDSGHGFFLYVGCKRYGMDLYEWDEKRDYFAEHPEWFSMSNAGGRSDRLQLCFSNKEHRKEFTKRVLERCRRVGGSGVLTIGANDVPGPFCNCPECKALIEKYETPAEPYWDYLPELSDAVTK